MTRPLAAIAAFVSWHRRSIGALLAGLSVLGLAHWLAGSDGATVPVLIAATDVPAGHALAAEDLRQATLPVDAVPAGALNDAAAALGATTAVPLSAGTVLQPGLLAGADAVDPGRAVVPIALADPGLRPLLRPGDRITLIVAAAESADVLTGDARVAAVPERVESTGLAVGSSQSDLLLVDVPAETAPMVAILGQGGQLSIALGGVTDGP